MRITLILIILNILIFFYTVPNLEYYVNNFGFRPSSFLGGKYYLIFTSLFLHAGLTHLLFNMLGLLILGTSLEKKLKSKKFLAVYFTGGMLANLAMFIPFFFSPNEVGVGASGAISSLVGAGTFLCPGKLVFFPSILPVPFVVAGALYFLSQVLNLFVPSQIAYSVHLFGMIIGGIFGLFWTKKRKRNVLLFILVLLLIIIIPYLLSKYLFY